MTYARHSLDLAHPGRRPTWVTSVPPPFPSFLVVLKMGWLGVPRGERSGSAPEPHAQRHRKAPRAWKGRPRERGGKREHTPRLPQLSCLPSSFKATCVRTLGTVSGLAPSSGDCKLPEDKHQVSPFTKESLRSAGGLPGRGVPGKLNSHFPRHPKEQSLSKASSFLRQIGPLAFSCSGKFPSCSLVLCWGSCLLPRSGSPVHSLPRSAP